MRFIQPLDREYWIDPKNSVTNDALIQTGSIARNTIPQGPTDNINETTLGNFKHVRGEKQQVKVGNIGGTDVPYVLTQFPYIGNVSAYADETLTGVTISPNGYLDFGQARDSRGNRFLISSSPTPATTFPDTPRMICAITAARLLRLNVSSM